MGTNKIDFFDHVIRSSKCAAPVGSEQFMTSLEESDVPESWLANKNRIESPETPMKEETIEWHTPFSPIHTFNTV